jgi:hypothetical protein
MNGIADFAQHTMQTNNQDGSSLGAEDFSTFQRSGRKRVIRLSRDELLALRKPTTVLPNVVEKLPKEIVSKMPLDPELLEAIDERVMHRIWHEISGGTRVGNRRNVTLSGKGGASPAFGPQNSPPNGPSNSGNRWGSGEQSVYGFGGNGWRRGPNGSAAIQGGLTASSRAGGSDKRSPLHGPLEGNVDGADCGSFRLGVSAKAEGDPLSASGAWRRGLKVGDALGTQRPVDNGANVDSRRRFDEDSQVDDLDANMDLSGLSVAALQFELEKRKMHDLFGGGEGDGLKDGGLGSGLDSGAGSSSSGLSEGLVSSRERQPFPSPLQSEHQRQPHERVQDFKPQVHGVHGLGSDVSSIFGGLLSEHHQSGLTPLMPPPPPPLPSDDYWFYKDPTGNVQGPFSGDLMRQWHSQGCFDSVPDLPLRHGPTGSFRPLSGMLQSGKMFHAIAEPHGDPLMGKQQEIKSAQRSANEEAGRMVHAGEVVQQLERAEQDPEEQKVELMRRELERAAAGAAPAEVKGDTTENRNRAEHDATATTDAAAERATAWGNEASMVAGRRNLSNSLRDIQAEETKNSSEIASHLKAMLGVHVGDTAFAGAGVSGRLVSAWGGEADFGAETGESPQTAGSVLSKRVGHKSLAEIQKEEQEEAAARAAMQPKPSGVWGGGTSAVGVAAAGSQQAHKAQQPVRIFEKSIHTPMLVTSQHAPTQSIYSAPVHLQQQPASAARRRGDHLIKVGATSRSAAQSTNKGQFSTNASDLDSWCSEQLRKINGSDDMTLVHFCLSLDDNSEIRSYFSEVLGASPAVSAFATEFIRRKVDAKRDGKINTDAAAGFTVTNPATSQRASAGGSKKSRNRRKK